MKVKISGKNIDIGNSLREYTEKEIENLIDKYVGEKVEATIFITKDHRLFDIECFVHLHRGFVIKSNGSSDDPYRSVNIALERMEDMIKKHKNRIKDKTRRKHWETESTPKVKSYILEVKEHSQDKDEEHLVIAEMEKSLLSLSVSEAAMKLDLTDVPVVMFRNSDSGHVNVVYKRNDGHIGWIDSKE